MSPGVYNNMPWVPGEEGSKKEQNRLEQANLGLGLMRSEELGAQMQGFRSKHTGSIWKNEKDSE